MASLVLKNMAFSWNNILILTFWNVKSLPSLLLFLSGVGLHSGLQCFWHFCNELFHLCSSKNCNPQSITIIKNVQVFCLKGENNTMSWHIQFLWKTTHVLFANIWKFEDLFFMHVFFTKISMSFSPNLLVLCNYLNFQRTMCFRISNISESGNQ
jgi:hypothetical protein